MNKSGIAAFYAEGNGLSPAHQQEQDLETIRRVADSLPREEFARDMNVPSNNGDPERLQDGHLESAYEDRYPEPYEGSVYDGTDNSDPGFYSDYGDG